MPPPFLFLPRHLLLDFSAPNPNKLACSSNHSLSFSLSLSFVLSLSAALSDSLPLCRGQKSTRQQQQHSTPGYSDFFSPQATELFCSLLFFSPPSKPTAVVPLSPIASQQQPAGEQHAAVKPTALLRPLTPAHADQACSAVLGHQGHRGTVLVDDLRWQRAAACHGCRQISPRPEKYLARAPP